MIEQDSSRARLQPTTLHLMTAGRFCHQIPFNKSQTGNHHQRLLLLKRSYFSNASTLHGAHSRVQMATVLIKPDIPKQLATLHDWALLSLYLLQ